MKMAELPYQVDDCTIAQSVQEDSPGRKKPQAAQPARAMLPKASQNTSRPPSHRPARPRVPTCSMWSSFQSIGRSSSIGGTHPRRLARFRARASAPFGKARRPEPPGGQHQTQRAKGGPDPGRRQRQGEVILPGQAGESLERAQAPDPGPSQAGKLRAEQDQDLDQVDEHQGVPGPVATSRRPPSRSLRPQRPGPSARPAASRSPPSPAPTARRSAARPARRPVRSSTLARARPPSGPAQCRWNSREWSAGGRSTRAPSRQPGSRPGPPVS